MKFLSLLRLAPIAAAIVFVPTALGLSGLRVGQYDFGYLTSGDLRSTPIQVFDDGKNTYFQFRAGDPIPAIFANKAGSVNLVVPVFEGPYVRVGETSGRFTLQLGKSQAQVVYGGANRDDVPKITEVAPNGMTAAYRGIPPSTNSGVRLLASLGSPAQFIGAESLDSNSYATPVKGDRVTWKESEVQTIEKQVYFVKGITIMGPAAKAAIAALLPQAKESTSIVVVGRDDESEKEGLDKARANVIRNALIAAGISADKISVKTGVQGSTKDKLWPSDIRMEKVLPTAVSRPSSQASLPDSMDRSQHVRSNLEALVRSGVLTKDQAQAILQRSSSAPAQQATSVQSEVPTEGFQFRAADRSVSETLRRWASTTAYQIVWEAPPHLDAPITGDAPLVAGSMKEAVERVVSGLNKSGYDLQATIYSNRVIRITPGVSK